MRWERVDVEPEALPANASSVERTTLQEGVRRSIKPPLVLAPPPAPEQLEPTVIVERLPPPEPEPARVETTPEQEWAEFERIGLGRKKAAKGSLAKLMVSVYRLLGFGILTVIVMALVGYIATTLFYMASSSWAVPTIVSPTDEHVVQLRGEIAKQQNEHDRITRELADAERAILVEQSYQTRFAAAIASDLATRRSALQRTRRLAGAAASTRAEIRASSEEFARDSAQRMREQFGAGMIDRHAMLDGKHQLAQISSANLSLAERQATFETAAADLAQQTKALDALLADRDEPLSYEVLEIKRRFEASRLALANANALRDTLLAQLARQTDVLATLRASAYLRAVDDGATVALVPYANLANATPGATVYACRFEMIACRAVGTVAQILPGEVPLRHPHRDSVLRGQMVELAVTGDAAHENVLFLGGKPLFF
ncbi:MAG: hypothetical protein ACKV2T_12370 [Kofleriaceae bacterium]